MPFANDKLWSTNLRINFCQLDISMYKAFRTNTEEILKMESSIKSTDIDKLKSLQKDFKQKIRPFILPKDGIIKGDTLKDTYFPTSKDGKPYDIFISRPKIRIWDFWTG